MINRTYILLLLLGICNAIAAQSFLYSGKPVFHGADRVGNYPNTFFIHTIAATGERPITFKVDGLPNSLSLDAATGIISGTAPQAGKYTLQITAVNNAGTSSTKLTLQIGDTLLLTPPMGWNSWNVFADAIDEKTIMEIADAMATNGMRDVGYQYINIDDFWHADKRDEKGNPVADITKFPHGIKYLSDYVHARGLKLGIYSCAGSMTCGERFGGYRFEEIDAQAYAAWGIDLLKYDYCYAPWGRKPAIERYTTMGTALKKSGRSIVFSVCEWGLRKPWKWATAAGGQYWRTTPDIFDWWKGWHPWQKSFMSILKKQNGLEKYAGPGKWNDPDMLIVGNYGKGRATSAKGKFKGLTDTQYQSHFSIWCMLNSPLLSSCDLRTMNDATKNILLNPALIAINQDAAGKQAVLIQKQKGVWIYRKELQNGVAYALLNTTNKSIDFNIPPSVIEDLNGKGVQDAISHNSINKLPDAINIEPYQTIVWIGKE